jgi:hypothetical protein
LFKKATRINLGDGSKANFWVSAWLHGHAPKDITPTLHKISKEKSRTVRNVVEYNFLPIWRVCSVNMSRLV